MTEAESNERRRTILDAARWCFLNFGFAKTSFEDVARRANISRTLLYRSFKDKHALFTSVFEDWLVSRQPEAKEIAARRTGKYERLIDLCRVLVIEPWAEMVNAPMGTEFYDVCARLDPEIEEKQQRVALECVTKILGDEEKAEVFFMALDGLGTDLPKIDVLERRVKVLVAGFAPPEKRGRS